MHGIIPFDRYSDKNWKIYILYPNESIVLLSKAIYRVKFVLRLTQLTSVLTRLNICQRGKSLRLGSNLYTACCKRKNTGRCFTITEAICTPFKRFFERFVVSVISIRDFLNGIREEVCNSPVFRNVNTNVWFVWSMFNS